MLGGILEGISWGILTITCLRLRWMSLGLKISWIKTKKEHLVEIQKELLEESHKVESSNGGILEETPSRIQELLTLKMAKIDIYLSGFLSFQVEIWRNSYLHLWLSSFENRFLKLLMSDSLRRTRSINPIILKASNTSRNSSHMLCKCPNVINAIASWDSHVSILLEPQDKSGQLFSLYSEVLSKLFWS